MNRQARFDQISQGSAIVRGDLSLFTCVRLASVARGEREHFGYPKPSRWDDATNSPKLERARQRDQLKRFHGFGTDVGMKLAVFPGH